MDWKKNRQKFQMPHDRVEKARKARFYAQLLERWQARQANREKGNEEI